MDDNTFRERADAALASLFQRLATASERYPMEPDMSGGALVIEFDDPPTKFVVSPNAPVKQIWISANLTSYKLDWDEAAGVFALDGKPLDRLVTDAMAKHLGQPVEL